jgi:hypothetical protein
VNRFKEGDDALAYDTFLRAHGYLFGRFNGYKYLTGVHDDGECEIYAPHFPPSQMPGIQRVLIQEDGSIDQPLPMQPRSPMD